MSQLSAAASFGRHCSQKKIQWNGNQCQNFKSESQEGFTEYVRMYADSIVFSFNFTVVICIFIQSNCVQLKSLCVRVAVVACEVRRLSIQSPVCSERPCYVVVDLQTFIK